MLALLMTVFSNEGANVKIILQKNVDVQYDDVSSRQDFAKKLVISY